MRRIILDTDPGVDDALAFMLAFASPEVGVEAVTTVDGNVREERGHGNAKRLLEFFGRSDVPVARGAARPLLRLRDHAEAFHGKTGLGDAVLPEPTMASDPRPAARLIAEEADRLGKDLTIVAIGPLTNVALAIAIDPDLPRKVGGLVIMGGAFNLTPYGVGNASPVAEFNVWHDPEAAKIVFESGIHVVCAGLDVTTHPENRLGPAHLAQIESAGTRRSRLASDLLRTLVGKYGGFSLHDPMSVAYVVDPTLFGTERHAVSVETRGEITEGMTVVDRRPRRPPGGGNAEIITRVDSARFLSLVLGRVACGE